MTDDIERRLIALETRLAHQENTIEELNELIYQQGQTVEHMKGDLEQIAQRLHRLALADDQG